MRCSYNIDLILAFGSLICNLLLSVCIPSCVLICLLVDRKEKKANKRNPPNSSSARVLVAAIPKFILVLPFFVLVSL
jgi:hypothetical protein